MPKLKKIISALFSLPILFLLSPVIVQADTQMEVASIMNIGKSLLSLFTINYELIFGFGSFLNGLLFLLIAWAIPSSKDTEKMNDPHLSLKKRQQLHQASNIIWKKIMVLIGLIFILLGIILITISAIM
ncbi:hypothetical protein [Enterococcus camelliae]|uniref:DUF3899 domain-containing protein n=1 Tax=Enterococcus camelliae TaxID=453959 RepID=A0ABW5TM99_9ENTE